MTTKNSKNYVPKFAPSKLNALTTPNALRELESRLTEAENFVSLCPELQNLLQTNLIAMRRELAGFQQLAQLAEARVIDAQEQLEIVMLDKEVVGKRAELTDTELEDVRARVAIPEVENNVLKEGSVEISLLFWRKTNLLATYRGNAVGDSPAKDSLADIQLEKQND
jgi:dynactin 1